MTNFTDHPPTRPPSRLSSRWGQLLSRHHWLPFVLPFVTFLLFGLLEPSPASGQPGTERNVQDAGAAAQRPPPALLSYPVAYTLRIAATCGAILLVWPSWRTIPRAITWRWAVGVGLLGGGLWISICRWRLEDRLLESVGLGDWASLGDRVAYNPYDALGHAPLMMAAFLAVRLVGLTAIVPLVEEFFLRGFLMRFVEKPDWWTIELGKFGGKAAVAATVYGVVAHPAEALAAALWFSLITLLYARTRRIWDCVLAHAVTNGSLGLYILIARDWTLW